MNSRRSQRPASRRSIRNSLHLPQRHKSSTGNQRQHTALQAMAKGWAAAHARCCVEALGRLQRSWLTSLLTVLVIGITLALPAGLDVSVKNLNGLTYSWKTSVQISLYLHQSVTD